MKPATPAICLLFWVLCTFAKSPGWDGFDTTKSENDSVIVEKEEEKMDVETHLDWSALVSGLTVVDEVILGGIGIVIIALVALQFHQRNKILGRIQQIKEAENAYALDQLHQFTHTSTHASTTPDQKTHDHQPR
jgi:hypothetical protein